METILALHHIAIFFSLKSPNQIKRTSPRRCDGRNKGSGSPARHRVDSNRRAGLICVTSHNHGDSLSGSTQVSAYKSPSTPTPTKTCIPGVW